MEDIITQRATYYHSGFAYAKEKKSERSHELKLFPFLNNLPKKKKKDF